MQTGQGENFWRPAADVYESGNELIVHIDLPGVPKSDINIEVTMIIGEF